MNVNKIDERINRKEVKELLKELKRLLSGQALRNYIFRNILKEGK